MVICKNTKYPLVKLVIPCDVPVTIDIMDNLKKVTFSDHDLRNFPKIHMSKYMTSLQLVEGEPIQLVPMEWPRGLDKPGILSLLYMPHFSCTTEVNMCVK